MKRKRLALIVAVSAVFAWFAFLFIIHLICLPFVWIDRRIASLWAV